MYEADNRKRNPETKFSTDKADSNFLYHQRTDMTPQLMEVLLKRKKQAAGKLYEARQKMNGNGKDSDINDLEAQTSDEGQDYRAIQRIVERANYPTVNWRDKEDSLEGREKEMMKEDQEYAKHMKALGTINESIATKGSKLKKKGTNASDVEENYKNRLKEANLRSLDKYRSIKSDDEKIDLLTDEEKEALEKEVGADADRLFDLNMAKQSAEGGRLDDEGEKEYQDLLSGKKYDGEFGKTKQWMLGDMLAKRRGENAQNMVSIYNKFHSDGEEKNQKEIIDLVTGPERVKAQTYNKLFKDFKRSENSYKKARFDNYSFAKNEKVLNKIKFDKDSDYFKTANKKMNAQMKAKYEEYMNKKKQNA